MLECLGLDFWQVVLLVILGAALGTASYHARNRAAKNRDPDAVRCRLCKGMGNDTTGRAVNGSPTPMCVRCGGYGTVPSKAWNPDSLTRGEENRIERERRARHV